MHLYPSWSVGVMCLAFVMVASQACASQATFSYRHFEVIEEDGKVTRTIPQSGDTAPQWAKDVSQEAFDWGAQQVGQEPIFKPLLTFVRAPVKGSGEPFHSHNHQPDITWLPNGDLLAIWYTTKAEQGTELTVLASRLRAGAEQWDPSSEFFGAADRNMHGSAIFHDGQGTIHHFNGMGRRGARGFHNLALLHRISRDNGVTWTAAGPISSGANYQDRHQSIAGVKATREGVLIHACDATSAMEGNTALHISRDGGQTWTDPGGDIRGIHAAVVELNDGRWLAFGRGRPINGRMAMSISEDQGKTWTYSASPFPDIGAVQRAVLMRLREGPLMLVSFTSAGVDRSRVRDGGMTFVDEHDQEFVGRGLFAALSFDEGQTWPTRKLLTPGSGTYEGGAWGNRFTVTPTQAEPTGYMAGTQTPDGMIHLISSGQHYRFNLAWLKMPNVAGPQVGQWRQQDLTEGERARLQFDVTRRINRATDYEVSFVYRSGEHGVDLHRVTLLEDGDIISSKEHAGWAGGAPRHTRYMLTVPAVREGANYTLEVEIGGGATESSGDIEMRAFAAPQGDLPHPRDNPTSHVMLRGDWFAHPHQIDFDKLPRVPTEHVVINDATDRNGVNQHNYLIHHDGQFWAMWSDGPAIEDRVGQVIKYATSKDGLEWSEARYLTDYPPNSGPDSPHYNTRSNQGFRYIARGFWVRDGQLLALLTLDEAAGFFGRSLKLLAYRWNADEGKWEEHVTVADNAINNFPPKQLPTGEWMMSRRPYDYSRTGVEFLVGGVEALDQWQGFPVPPGPLAAEEPYWWVLPDGNLMALFRDNRQSGYIYRSFSIDNGRTWSQPVQTDFPDARSKFHGLRMSDGRYVLVNNPHPRHRDPLTLAISDDGLVFDRMYHLVSGRGGNWGGVDYPMVMEHEGYLYIAHTGGHGRQKQSIEMQRVRIADLDTLKMQPAHTRTPAVPPPFEVEIEGIKTRVAVRGNWQTSDRSDQKFGETYYFMAPRGHGRVRYTAQLPEPGTYAVYGWWNSLGQRHDAVPYTITHADGQTTVRVDQNEQGGQWVRLGQYRFTDTPAIVDIEAQGFTQYIVAEAVRFVKLE